MNNRDNKWVQITESQRKVIYSMLATNSIAKAVGISIGVNSTSVSREIKRHLIKTKDCEVGYEDRCPIHHRFPHCCNGCPKKYAQCHESIWLYKPSRADEEAISLRTSSRMGLNMTKEEYEHLDVAVKNGLALNKSLYDIVKGDKDIHITLSTVYRLIREGKLSAKKYDLPYAVTYKKRKKENKKYVYSENNSIDRSKRAYLDYLAFIKENPNCFISQLDFLGSIKTYIFIIITCIIPILHFPIIEKIENPDSNKVISFLIRLKQS